MKIDRLQYVPVVKGKKGEVLALREVRAESRPYVVPIIEVLRADNLPAFLKGLAEAWPTGTLMLDTTALSGARPLLTAASIARDEGLQVVPVVPLRAGPRLRRAAARIAAEDGRGLGIRVAEDDAHRHSFVDRLHVILEAAGLAPDEALLLLDLGAVPPDEPAALLARSRAMLEAVPYVERWGGLVLTATSFPKHLAGIPPGLARLPRAEWENWCTIALGGWPRTPSYGDYGPSHNEMVKIDGKLMRVSASIRCTGDSEYLIARGRWLGHPDHGGYEQYHELSQAMTRTPECQDAAQSWGTGRIHDCAMRRVGPGNLTQWRAVAVNQHIERVVARLANWS